MDQYFGCRDRMVLPNRETFTLYHCTHRFELFRDEGTP